MTPPCRIRRVARWWAVEDTRTGDRMLAETWAAAIREVYPPAAEPDAGPEWITPQEAAWTLRCSTRALALWAKAGRLDVKRLPSGHRRYRGAQVRAMAQEGP